MSSPSELARLIRLFTITYECSVDLVVHEVSEPAAPDALLLWASAAGIAVESRDAHVVGSDRRLAVDLPRWGQIVVFLMKTGRDSAK